MSKHSYSIVRSAGATVFMVVAALALCAALASCADAAGLHNQRASTVSFSLVNIPAADGEYALPGEYQASAWDNGNADLVLKDGSGTTGEYTVAKSSFTFSIVPKGGWSRPWYPTVKGNSWDYNSGGAQWNFRVTDLPLGQAVIITIDGADSPVDPVLEAQ